MLELYCEDDPTTLTPVGGICKSAVDTWGFEKQLDVVVEELSELILAIQKWKRYRNERRAQDVAGETADVRLVLLQLQYMFDTSIDRKFTYNMNETLEFKQKRIQERIAKYQTKLAQEENTVNYPEDISEPEPVSEPPTHTKCGEFFAGFVIGAILAFAMIVLVFFVVAMM